MKDKFTLFKNSKMTQVSLYAIFTIVASFVLIHLVQHLDLVFAKAGAAIHWLGVIFVPLAIGFSLAYLLMPLVTILEKRLSKVQFFTKKPGRARNSAVAITLISLLALIIIGLSIVISMFSHEAKVVSTNDFSEFIDSFAINIRTFFNDMSKWVENLNLSSDDLSKTLSNISDVCKNYAKNFASSIVGRVSIIPQLMANLVFAIIFAIYFLMDANRLTSYWDRVLKAFSGEKTYKKIHIFINDCDKVFSGYIRGQLLDALFMTLIVGISLSLLNVKFAVIIGVATGIGNLIPYVGPVVAYVSTALVCLVNGDLKKLIIAIIVIFIVQTIDGNVINPKLLSQNISIHPMLVIAALIIGSAIGGVLGMLMAVPVAALIKMQFDRVIDYAILRKEKEKAEPESPGSEKCK